MSKGLGSKIAIKFTDDLIGGVIGNESAFKVEGQQYKYVGGLLIDKEYLINKVERYPVQRLWSIEEEVKLDSEGNSEEQIGWNAIGFISGNPATGTRGYKFKVLEDVFVTALRMMPTETNSTIHLWNVGTGELLANVTAPTTIGQWNNIPLETPLKLEQNVEYMVSANYTTGNGYYRNASASQGEFNSLLTYLGHFTGGAYNIMPNTSVVWANAVDILFTGIPEHTTPKVYETETIQLTGYYRVNWQEDKPMDTDIVIEYTTGEIQGQWIEVANGEVINVDTNIWIRVTLSTSDTSLTPTLYDLWLEDSSAPQDKILITMEGIQGRFPTVEGNLTVEYDASIGNLTGQGGAVESFVAIFTPTDLTPEPNPGIIETITGAPTISINYLEVTYHKGNAAEETITAAPAEITVAFLSTEVINP